MNTDAYVNYAASVAFALVAAFLIGGKVAALACMIAWAAAYCGMYCAALRPGYEYANAVWLASQLLTAAAATTMVAAWLFT